MPEEMQVAPALTRALRFTPGDGGPARDVLVTIGPPKQNGEDFDVTLEILGFDKPHRTEHPGVDPIAATLSAAHLAPHILKSLATGGHLTWDDEEDLGFLPPPKLMEP